jgi:hypothetical protein
VVTATQPPRKPERGPAIGLKCPIVGLEFTPLSKPFKTKEQAEKGREKYPECLRKRIGVGVTRIKK